jgi:Ferredoxin subunits of nitrite reductase and ring-hydroxylating dioxygenases
MRINTPKLKKVFLLFIFISAVNGCKSDDYQIFPNVSVYVSLDAAVLARIGVGSYDEYSGGVKGIVVYQSMPGEYQAYDKLCTNYPSDTATLVFDKGTNSATCPKCGSKFSLPLNGMVTKGPAKYSLMPYRVTYYSSGRLIISN